MEEKIEKLLKQPIESLGYELYDVIYEKEGKDYYLRIFIDSSEGISLEDCENVNNAISDLLDEANYIKDQYFLEVSSPGVERVLRKNIHLEASINKEIAVSLFKPISINETSLTQNDNAKKENLKQLEGILKQFDENTITLEVQVENSKRTIKVDRKNISKMHLKYNWDEL